MARKSPADLAAAMEAELDEYPDERAEILLEAAEQWRQAGNDDRAVVLLTEVAGMGGEDAGHARVALADLYFRLGRDEQAHAELDTLRQNRPASPSPYHLAGELMEERGDLQEALTWFNMAVARLEDEEMADLGPMTYAGSVVGGRRRVRTALELPPDELDESVHDHREQIEDLFEALTPPTPRGETRVLFWPRAEIPVAHETWPVLVEHADADAILADREAANRELSEAGATRITMVPLTVATLAEFATRTGGDPLDESTRMACMAEVDATVSWPPERNAPCWCGSGRKYKKCCGRPR
jgi:tetratricopeptide (TPR) repeat protein